MANEKMVAMLLAGGKGTRLESLTKKMAKPAVFFGGKYRIIDFPLSNCANSGINCIGVLTQSETADAIYQNIDFLDERQPDYVAILSGDHIYKMDYSKMLEAHIKNDADLTIAVLNVSLEEAKRFGIMKADETGRITNFTEKPKHPESTLASMGIYIFSYKVLREYLIKDHKNPDSDNDFGKNVIPEMLAKKKKLYAYEFEGYWKDVGTISSLWEANMDLLDGKCTMNLYENTQRIFSEDTHSLPQLIGETGSVHNSMINQGAEINGSVTHSVIFNEVVVEEGAEVVDSVIMPNTVIKAGVKIRKAIVGPDLIITSSKEPTEDEVILVNN